MLPLRSLFQLDLSAASGLARVDDRVFVVADDEHFLDSYELASGQRERLVLPLGGELPEEHRARKRAKADLESLTRLDDRRLLTLGSGSSPARERGVVVDVSGTVPPQAIDLHPLYASLRAELPALNIEGASAAGGVLRLLHRANEAQRVNAVIELDLAQTLRAIEARESLQASLVRRVVSVALDALDGIALGFTDACPVSPDSSSLYFVAAAEDTDNPYEDGECVGSVLGLLDEECRVVRIERLSGRHKMEGLSVRGAQALLVADPDSRDVRATLFETRLDDAWR